MSKYPVTIGVICLGRHTYDTAAAAELYAQFQEDSREIPAVNWCFVESLVVEKEDAAAAAGTLTAALVDAVIIISGTFHLGHLALTIDRHLKKPLYLQAFEELPYNGGKIRLNSVCGLNLNASNLYKYGTRDFHYGIGNQADALWIDAVRMKAVLEKSHIGLAGFRADGFFNLGIDELSVFQDTGVLLDHYELLELYDQEVTEEAVGQRFEKLQEQFEYSEVGEEKLSKLAKLCVSAERFLEQNHLDAAAIRCWPEHARDYGIAPCAMMSVLQGEGKVLACEGDVEGALTMLALRAVQDTAPFLADLSQVDFEEDYALMWHCGVAPCSLWDERSERSLDTYFAGGRGVTSGFVLKEGAVTVVRIDSVSGRIRLCFGKGEALHMEKMLSGTYAKVRYDKPVKEVLEGVVKNGIAHHFALVYGEYEALLTMFANIMGWEIIRL